MGTREREVLIEEEIDQASAEALEAATDATRRCLALYVLLAAKIAKCLSVQTATSLFTAMTVLETTSRKEVAISIAEMTDVEIEEKTLANLVLLKTTKSKSSLNS